MKLYEYAAKDIFLKYGIPIPKGNVIIDPNDARENAVKLGVVVVKAQVATGGRGKAGGIAVASNQVDAVKEARRILGMSIKGMPVRKVLVEEYKKAEKEMYLGITIDRSARRPIIIVSQEGGVDIEEISRISQEKIMRVHINPLTGIHDYQARNLASFLDRENSAGIAEVIKKLYHVFIDNDCILAEINPLALTTEGIFALDAKMIVDDNALFRQDVEGEEPDALAALAKKNGMSYVGLDGDIGCIVNGAGLAMATLDMIKQHGGDPANFMDVRAGANAEQVKTALRIVSSNKNVKTVLINIFGGLTKCDEVARGIIDAGSEINLPIVIRLAGTNEEKGRAMLEGLGITFAMSTEEAAGRVIELGNPDQ
ncbi:MAG: ADP-forming succinate--CoA ligase subunit beta [Candidatus Methanoperedens sp.]|nr:ADP-forming succinate--CoA ligase subunit beta [Candidatus Methanoperedens sp.]MCZ7371762.1 ADP-forming succinate--CoA ligase subunit beta [Candidatus Methanoperedens sp.]